MDNFGKVTPEQADKWWNMMMPEIKVSIAIAFMAYTGWAILFKKSEIKDV